LLNPALGALLIACAMGLWLNRRLLLGLVVFIAALSLYLPYVVLPNHLSEVYQWPPMPLLMLLVPLAWTASPRGARPKLAANAAIALTLIVAIGFQSTQYREQKYWSRVVLEQNRSVLAALGSLQPQISRSHAILVRGFALSFETLPWAQNAQFLSHELGFTGEWSVATEPGYPPIQPQAHARPIRSDRIDYRDYDLVIVFDSAAKLVGSYGATQFASIPRSEPLFYPAGIVPPASRAAAIDQGLYPETTSTACCFLSGAARLRLAKPIGALRVVLEFNVPDTPPFAGQPERVSVAFGGISVGPPIALVKGVQDVSLPLPARLANEGVVTAALRMSIAYVPKQIGMNEDTRRLSIMLLRVRYR